MNATLRKITLNFFGLGLLCSSASAQDRCTTLRVSCAPGAVRTTLDCPGDGSYRCVAAVNLPLLEVVTFGGMRAPSGPRRTGIRIYRDGRVLNFSYSGAQPTAPVETLVVQLDAHRLASFDQQARSVLNAEGRMDGEVRFPDRPRCLDAPATQYLAISPNGLVHRFAERNGCQLGVLSTQVPGATIWMRSLPASLLVGRLNALMAAPQPGITAAP